MLIWQTSGKDSFAQFYLAQYSALLNPAR